MRHRDTLRARLAGLRADLDEIEDTLDPDGGVMSDEQITGLGAKIDRLASKIQDLAIVVARIEERSESDRRDAAERAARQAALDVELRAVQRHLDEEAGARKASDKLAVTLGGTGILGAGGAWVAWLLQFWGAL